MRLVLLSSAVLVSACMTPGNATQPEEGLWGTPGTVLTLTAAGGMLEEGCAQTALGPIRTDANGRFTATGRLTTWGGGPQQADVPAEPARPIAVDGRIEGDRMTLRLTGDGLAPRELTLQRGLRAKVIRCL